ncbi:amidohydrolase family protein [candidate division KSB1 bacterium]|nr:amidohydrolase family protein [candidate division KSB1 bacterium]
MRFLLTLFMNILLVTSLFAQVATTALTPKPGFEDRIRKAVDDIWLIDTHEHLYTEEERIESGPHDVYYMFMPYARNLLSKSGMSDQDYQMIQNKDIPIQERWKVISPYWKFVRSTGYGRAAILAANDIFGIPDINDNTYLELSQKINESNKPGWFKHVLKDKARIEISIVDRRLNKEQLEKSKDFFLHVDRFQHFVWVLSGADIRKVANRWGIEKVRTLDDYLKGLNNAFSHSIDLGMVGVKCALAYERILHYEDVPREEAEQVFNKLISSDSPEKDMPFEEVKPLQDYMMHRVLDLTRDHNYPFQIHTGINSTRNPLRNSSPAHLHNLFLEYPDVKFCIFHGSYPYGGELAALANCFQNVYIDMTWLYVISPSYAKRYLHEWIETVPVNKIMAFGGDYRYVELAYAHAKMAREIVSDVLIEKVVDRYFTEKEAIYIAKRILRENAIEVLNLENRLAAGK